MSFQSRLSPIRPTFPLNPSPSPRYALFCTSIKVKSPLFCELRALLRKHPGRGVSVRTFRRSDGRTYFGRFEHANLQTFQPATFQCNFRRIITIPKNMKIKGFINFGRITFRKSGGRADDDPSLTLLFFQFAAADFPSAIFGADMLVFACLSSANYGPRTYSLAPRTSRFRLRIEAQSRRSSPNGGCKLRQFAPPSEAGSVKEDQPHARSTCYIENSYGNSRNQAGAFPRLR